MDKAKDTGRWSRKRQEKHGKMKDIKDQKSDHGFPRAQAWRNHKDEYHPIAVHKEKELRRMKETLRKI